MDALSGESMKIKTEWSATPNARKKSDDKVQSDQSVGKRLNEMTGVESKIDDPYKATKKKDLDKDAFLKMFMTQLKYQDPTSPVDNQKMAQQMAMFSQLEQSVTTNQYLEKILSKSGDNSEMAFGMMGKEITANRAALTHSKLESTPFDIKLPQDAATIKVEITNEVGDPLRTMEYGTRPEGKFQVRWDGKLDDESNAPSGRYFYKVKGTALNGEEFTIEDKVQGMVTGISKTNGETFLLIGDKKVSMNEVNMVKMPEVMPSTVVDKNLATASKNGEVANNVAGTKSESKTVGAETGAMKDSKEPKIEIDDNVRAALSGSGLDEGSRMNSLMPLFMR